MILIGDALEQLRTLPSESVQCCVTSPPYWGLRDYGCEGQIGLEATPEEWCTKLVEVFREVRRVLRDDGTLWLNVGDAFSHGGNGARDVHAKKGSGVKPKDLIGLPWMLAFALRADGWYLRSDIIWAKPNPMPESVTDRPTRSHEYLFLLSKSPRYYYDADAIRTPLRTTRPELLTFGEERPDVGFPGHSNRRRRATPREAAAAAAAAEGSSSTRRREGLNARWVARERAVGNGQGRLIDHVREARRAGQGHDTVLTPAAGANARSVWTIATNPYSEAHFATFPIELPHRCIAAASREGETVLDPFAGSGTTLSVAKRLGRRYIGIELNPAYLPLIEARLEKEALPLLDAIEASGHD